MASYMRKFTGAAGAWIALLAALTLLFAGVAALLLTNSLRGQLEDSRTQLQETQGELRAIQDAKAPSQKAGQSVSGTTTRQSGGASKTQARGTTVQPQSAKGQESQMEDQQQETPVETQLAGESEGGYPLLLALGVVILVSSVFVVKAARSLVKGGSEPVATQTAGIAKVEAIPPPETSDVGRAASLEDRHWTKLVEECVEVVEELDAHMGEFDAPRREVAEHVIMRLEEILRRSGVEVIANDVIFDRTRHKPDTINSELSNGVAVRETLSPGFALGRRVLRRARVRLE